MNCRRLMSDMGLPPSTKSALPTAPLGFPHAEPVAGVTESPLADLNCSESKWALQASSCASTRNDSTARYGRCQSCQVDGLATFAACPLHLQ